MPELEIVFGFDGEAAGKIEQGLRRDHMSTPRRLVLGAVASEKRFYPHEEPSGQHAQPPNTRSVKGL